MMAASPLQQPLSVFPLEVWAIIGREGGLQAYDLVRMSAVCRGWYHLSHALEHFLPDQARHVHISSKRSLHAWMETDTRSWDFHTHVAVTPAAYSSIGSLYPSLLGLGLLGRAHTLDLRDCRRVVDVSAHGSVHTLDLRDCCNVVDVSALGSVHTLGLSFCDNVVDVSALGRVHNLNLGRCDNVVDVSALGGVHTLNLFGCRGVVDVSALGNVHTLNLESCDNVVDVSALNNVPQLYCDVAH